MIFMNTLALQYVQVNMRIFYPFFIIWGSWFILKDLKEKNYKDKLCYPLLCFGILMIVSTIVFGWIQKKSVILGIEIALLQMIIFCILFCNSIKQPLNHIKEEINHISTFICKLTFVATLISLCMFMINFSSTQNHHTIGLVQDRLFGIYFNCNPAAFLASMSILFSVYHCKNNKQANWFYKINIVVQFIYIILTRSRTATIILAFYILFYAYSYWIKQWKKSKLFKTVCCMMLFILCLVSSNMLQKTLYTIPRLQGAIVYEESRFPLEEVKKAVTLLQESNYKNIRPSMEVLNTLSSGRIELFFQSLNVWNQSKWIGIGAGQFLDYARKLHPYSIVLKGDQVVHTHDVFLEPLITTGVLGWCMFLLFLVITLYTIYKNRKQFHKEKNISTLCIMIVLTEWMGGFFDYGVFYVYSVSAALSWLFFGYFLNLIKRGCEVK